jgi:hypothetical protein
MNLKQRIGVRGQSLVGLLICLSVIVGNVYMKVTHDKFFSGAVLTSSVLTAACLTTFFSPQFGEDPDKGLTQIKRVTFAGFVAGGIICFFLSPI